jgi:nucleoside-diphosphate-sugar epimerase
MKIVVIGGTGRVGSDAVRRLVAQGHDPVPASPSTGVDTITGEGLTDRIRHLDRDGGAGRRAMTARSPHRLSTRSRTAAGWDRNGW